MEHTLQSKTETTAQLNCRASLSLIFDGGDDDNHASAVAVVASILLLLPLLQIVHMHLSINDLFIPSRPSRNKFTYRNWES